MNDAILASADREEALSRAYVTVVAARAGYTLAMQDFDRDGVDVQVRAGGAMRPSLDVQLKATVRLVGGERDAFRYPLRRRNYDLLRMQSLVPRILVVLDLPEDESQWVSISTEELVMRRCAYWANIKGLPESTNRETVTVEIRKQNRFDAENLSELMDRVRTGDDLMKARILDAGTLKAVTPPALAAYARSEGWTKTEVYGDHADLYRGEDLPEIVLPRTDLLADYASVVSRLVGIFGEVAGRDELAVYRDLIGADHDVVRVHATGVEDDGSILLDEGVKLVSQAREMLLAAAACAATAPRPVYRAGANREAAEYMRQVRLGQTEHGSFVVTLMAPVPPMLQPMLDASWPDIDDEPYERQVTRCLVRALGASRDAAERAHSGDGAPAFQRAVSKGVSANLCDAVAGLIEQSGGLEVSVNWAGTRPAPKRRTSVLFSESDAGAFKEAARTFRAKEPRPDVKLFGSVHKLTRAEHEIDGHVTFKLDMDGRIQSVSSVLDRNNYSVAIRAHDARNPIAVTGDLERIEQRWRVVNATVREVASDEDDEF